MGGQDLNKPIPSYNAQDPVKDQICDVSPSVLAQPLDVLHRLLSSFTSEDDVGDLGGLAHTHGRPRCRDCAQDRRQQLPRRPCFERVEEGAVVQNRWYEGNM